MHADGIHERGDHAALMAQHGVYAHAFRLQSEAALTLAEKRGFNRDELANLPNVHFVSRSELGSETRGVLKF